MSRWRIAILGVIGTGMAMRLWHKVREWRRGATDPAESGIDVWYRLNLWQRGVLVLCCAYAYFVCVGPTYSSNVLPHLLACINPDGSLNSGEVTTTIGLTGAVTLISFAGLIILELSWPRKFLCAGLCAWLVFMTVNNATGTIGKTHDAAIDPNRAKIEHIHAHEAEIKRLEQNWKDATKPTKRTTGPMVEAAQKAADELAKSAEGECRWRGRKCEELEQKRDAANATVVTLQGDKALSDALVNIETLLDAARKKLTDDGPLPAHTDAETERFVAFLAAFNLISADQAKALSDHKPVINAIGYELLASFGTAFLFTGIFALFRRMASSQSVADKRMLEVLQRIEEEKAAKAAEKHAVVLHSVPHLPIAEPERTFADMFGPGEAERCESETLLPDTPPAAALGIEGDPIPAFVEAPETVAEVKAAALLKADPRKQIGRKARGKPKAASEDSVLQWVKERAMQRPGRRTAYGDAITDYNHWCADLNLIPLPQTTVGKTLVNEVKVQKRKIGGVLYFMDFGLHPAALRVAAG